MEDDRKAQKARRDRKEAETTSKDCEATSTSSVSEFHHRPSFNPHVFLLASIPLVLTPPICLSLESFTHHDLSPRAPCPNFTSPRVLNPNYK